MPRGGARPGAGRKRTAETAAKAAAPKPARLNSGAPANRTATGQFVPGVSGNPSGRPKGERSYLVEKYGDDARMLHEAMDKLLASPKTPPHVKSDILKFKIERHSGKAPQTVGVAGVDGQPMGPRRVIIELSDGANP